MQPTRILINYLYDTMNYICLYYVTIFVTKFGTEKATKWVPNFVTNIVTFAFVCLFLCAVVTRLMLCSLGHREIRKIPWPLNIKLPIE